MKKSKMNGRNQAMYRENMFLAGRVSQFPNRVFFGSSETAAPLPNQPRKTGVRMKFLYFKTNKPTFYKQQF